MVAVKRLRDFDANQASFTTWLNGIADNVVRERLRRRRRDAHEVVDDVGSDDDAVAQSDRLGLVRTAMAALPDRYRMVLEAKYFDGATVEEIAVERNESPKAVESSLGRAREAFRRVWRRTENDHDV